MADFYNKKSSGKRRSDDRGGFKGKKRFGDFGGERRGNDRGDRERPDMHSATCSKCNASCKVPFKPNGRKPIYCSDCFEKEGNGASNSRFGSPRSDRPGSFDKPAYRSTPRSENNDEVVKQLKTLNIKIDQLIKVMSALTVEPLYEEEEDEEINEHTTIFKESEK